jgi:hypothetical protein
MEIGFECFHISLKGAATQLYVVFGYTAKDLDQ